MVRQWFFRIGTPALAVAALLLVAQPSFAQRRGGGGWRGGRGSAGWYGGTGWQSGWQDGNRGWSYYPGYGVGLSYGGYYPSFGSSNYGYAPDNYASRAATSGYESFYPAPINGEQPALINIWAPAGAELWIDGVEQTASNQTYRQFQSQPLTPGYRYSYTLKARWTENGQPVEQTRKIRFQAGEQANVNFLVPAGNPALNN